MKKQQELAVLACFICLFLLVGLALASTPSIIFSAKEKATELIFFLSGIDLGGNNITNVNYLCFLDATCSNTWEGLGNGEINETDPYWSANYSLYNASWSDITNTSYYLASNPLGFWNDVFATFNRTFADTLYYAITNPFNFLNATFANYTVSPSQDFTTPKTCSQVFSPNNCDSETLNDTLVPPCNGTQNPSSSDYPHVKEVYINASAFLFNNAINATCEFKQTGGGINYEYIWYFNNSGWTKIANFSNSSVIDSVNRSANFTVNSTEGVHVVRCILSFDNPTSNECASVGWHDNDDVNFTVVSALYNDTVFYNYYNMNNKNVTNVDYLCFNDSSCSDTWTGLGGGNTTEEIRDAVNNSGFYNITANNTLYCNGGECGGAYPKFQVSIAYGTAGLDVGTGYLGANKEFGYEIYTGEELDGYFYRGFNHPFLYLDDKIDIESALNTEFTWGADEGAYVQTFFILGTTYYSAPQSYSIGGDQKYAGIWFVNDATYEKRILAVTRDLTGAEITDCGEWVVGWFYSMKIENRETYVKYYINDVLVATHTTHLPWASNYPTYSRTGISSQTAGCDEGTLFYYFKITVWD